MPVNLHYETVGEGEPVLILHGLFGSGRNLFTLARRLAGRFRVILPDARNHGKSEHTQVMSYHDMGDDVSDILRQTGHSRVNVIGHSMGGKTAMTFALNHPGLVHRLVVLDVAPVHYDTDLDVLIDHMLSLDLENITARSEADQRLAEMIPQDQLRAFLLHNLVKRDGNFSWKPNLPVIRDNMNILAGFPADHREHAWSGPALFLAGSRSDYLQQQHHEPVRIRFPHAVIKTVSDAGHWLHAEQPETVAGQIDAFLS